MLRYIVKRVIAGFLSLFMLITLTFFLMHVIPGGPFSPGEYRKTPPEVLKQIQDSYGLNDPIYAQYGRYLNNLAHGNLGVSFKKLNYSVNELIGNGAPVSAKVGFWAILLALIIGIPLGTTAAVRRGHLADGISMVIATVGVSVPSFVLCVLSMYLFCDKLKLLPTYGLDSWNCLHPAGGLYGIWPDCLHYTSDAFQHAGDHAPGFHPHRAQQGDPGAGGDRKICTEELHSSGCYLCGSNGSSADDGYLYY